MVDGARSRSVLVSLVLALALPALLHLFFGDRNLNLADEGYLWYGVQRTVAGEVPLRDFQAYDPGRYYWCALWAPLFGTGILGVRAALAVYQAMGLFFGLLVSRRIATHWSAQLLFAVVLELWMFPRHKLFEPATALMTAWFAVRLLERPSLRRHLAAGAMVGFAGYMGRNLGLYAGLATGALVLLNGWKVREAGFLRRAGAWALGVVLGYLPNWILLLFAPGYAASLVESVVMFAKTGANMSRPWPWPWRIDTDGLSTLAAFDIWFESLAYFLPVLALPALVWCVLRTPGERLPRRAACLGSSVVALVFLHHAMVRSDAPHLAQCIHPLLLALFALPTLLEKGRTRTAALVWSGLGLLTLGVAWTSNPTFTTTLGRESVVQEVAGEELRLLPSQASYLATLEGVIEQRVGDGGLFVAPNRPTLYPLLGKTAPTWWIYFLWESSNEQQRVTIERLRERNVHWALVIDAPTEGREELLFRNTNPLVWQHFQAEWERERLPPNLAHHSLFRR